MLHTNTSTTFSCSVKTAAILGFNCNFLYRHYICLGFICQMRYCLSNSLPSPSTCCWNSHSQGPPNEKLTSCAELRITLDQAKVKVLLNNG